MCWQALLYPRLGMSLQYNPKYFQQGAYPFAGVQLKTACPVRGTLKGSLHDLMGRQHQRGSPLTVCGLPRDWSHGGAGRGGRTVGRAGLPGRGACLGPKAGQQGQHGALLQRDTEIEIWMQQIRPFFFTSKPAALKTPGELHAHWTPSQYTLEILVLKAHTINMVITEW